jgi:hypothetical protein
MKDYTSILKKMISYLASHQYLVVSGIFFAFLGFIVSINNSFPIFGTDIIYIDTLFWILSAAGGGIMIAERLNDKKAQLREVTLTAMFVGFINLLLCWLRGQDSFTLIQATLSGIIIGAIFGSIFVNAKRGAFYGAIIGTAIGLFLFLGIVWGNDQIRTISIGGNPTEVSPTAFIIIGTISFTLFGAFAGAFLKTRSTN